MYGTKLIKKIYQSLEETVNVSSRMYYLQFAFKGPKYVKNVVFY